ncbi:kinesin-related protein 8-like [Anopheles albimanus]|nr:kinesin-related protein 8-like [Anopheles albimanus]XP_035775695.1 kinesin-related protein 8-like [Anopheles albimanus]XP_035775696.1 kinesin-related protein 8-like [Anopheles albimanus]XP_035775698.1 kinesin-related protein 8-like [Anopheles albimanus]XP_035775699.1 kinesin-related protein 8-like [Anopheles albimanus]XP_035775700.1 kinesin-related protein 8-like [Anopheles albimanus]
MMAFRRAGFFCLGVLLLYLAAGLAAGTSTTGGGSGGSPPQVRGRASNPSPRLPRTSASQLSAQNNVTATSRGSAGKAGTGNSSATSSSQAAQGRGNYRTREQQLLNVFEVVVSTLEGKLQRIDNLDKAVEHLMRRVESLDSKVADNIVKTDSVISKLRTLDSKLSVVDVEVGPDRPNGVRMAKSTNTLDSRLVSLDQKVSDIDSKLNGLKSQIDSNFLPVDDINAEASERKTVSMNVAEITKAMHSEVMGHITKELGQLRSISEGIDKKLQFHINVVSENLGKTLNLLNDVHDAVVDHGLNFGSYNATSTLPPYVKSSKIDILVKQIRPIMSVSEKMDEVWDVVVGTKSSVDDLVPKSDALLTQNQRQERAIGEIHHDLKTKTNLIINNLDMVEKRLKKQEDDVAVLAQRPVPAELLMDPTIDRLVEYDPNRYIVEDFTEALPTTTYPTSSSSASSSPSSSSTSTTSSSTSTSSTTQSNSVNIASGTGTAKNVSRKGGIIFPSVKNKPSVLNSTFASDSLFLKDIKGYSCVDLMNAGMRQSGVYYLQIRGTTYWFLKVFCEQEIADGGWTVIQRRDDYGDPRENFNRDWADYKNGFGDPAKEFWLGNENIYMLTNNEDYSLRVELEDFEGNKRYAQYSHFKIHSEQDYYKLEIDGYEGNAGDSLNDPWYGSNNSPFSTYNRDNDRSSLNCASMLKGGWWWKSCGRGLNGLYLHDPQDLTARQGIVWFRWRGWDYTLKKATMMIKPKGPQPQVAGAT